MEIWSFNNYQKYFAHTLKGRKKEWGFQAKLARASGVQSSYISQVISGKSHLTTEQGIKIGQFLSLSESELDYFVLMIELSRTSGPEARAFFKRKMKVLKESQEELVKRFNFPEKLSELSTQGVYYSAWYWAAIQILTGIESFQELRQISQRLRMPEEFVKDILSQLVEFGLVRRDGRKWKNTKKSLHLPKDSVFTSLNHSHWRNYAQMNIQLKDPSALHYSAVQSFAIRDFSKFKAIFLQAIDESRALAKTSPGEEVFVATCDVFRL